MQYAHKAFWRDIKVYSTGVKMHRAESSAADWWTMCVLSSPSGGKTGPGQFRQWTKSRWETKMMMRLFRFGRRKEETRSCKEARKTWIQMGLPFLYETIAESMWRATGWVCDQRPETVTDSLKQAFRWRSSRWWYTTQTEGMRDDPMNHTNWKHKWKRHNRGNVWDKNCFGLGW